MSGRRSRPRKATLSLQVQPPLLTHCGRCEGLFVAKEIKTFSRRRNRRPPPTFPLHLWHRRP